MKGDYAGSLPLPLGRVVLPFDQLSEATKLHVRSTVDLDRPPKRETTTGHATIPARAWFEWYWRRGIDPINKPPRPKVTPAQRQRIIERDGLRCGICGQQTHTNDVEIDHVIPLAHGGPHEDLNLQVTHPKCNRSKGSRLDTK